MKMPSFAYHMQSVMHIKLLDIWIESINRLDPFVNGINVKYKIWNKKWAWPYIKIIDIEAADRPTIRFDIWISKSERYIEVSLVPTAFIGAAQLEASFSWGHWLFHLKKSAKPNDWKLPLTLRPLLVNRNLYPVSTCHIPLVCYHWQNQGMGMHPYRPV